MKVIDGKIVRVVQTCSFEVVKDYLKDNPEYELLDTETWGDNIFARDNWYYLIHKDCYKNDRVTIDLTQQCVIIIDAEYAKLRVRIPDEPVVKNYIEWAVAACNLFYEGNVPFIYLPKLSSTGNIEVIYPHWNMEREETVKILRELCEEFGDNLWPDDLYLRDVIEKHLAKYLWKRK